MSFGPEGLRYQGWSPEKAGMEKEGSTKLHDCMLKLEYRKLSSSAWSMPPSTAVRTQVALHCLLAERISEGKGSREPSTPEAFILGPIATKLCSFSPGPKATLYAVKSYWNRYLLFLLALPPAFENSAVSIQAERIREKGELYLDD